MIRVIGFLIALLVSSVATAQVVSTFTVGIIENDPNITETCIYRVVDQGEEKVACVTPDSYIDDSPLIFGVWKIAEIPVTLPAVDNDVSYVAYNIITMPDDSIITTESFLLGFPANINIKDNVAP